MWVAFTAKIDLLYFLWFTRDAVAFESSTTEEVSLFNQLFIYFLTNLFIYLFQHRALHYNLHYIHNFTYIIDKRVLKWTTL